MIEMSQGFIIDKFVLTLQTINTHVIFRVC